MSTKENIQREAEAANEKLSEASEAIRSQADETAHRAREAAEAYADEGKRTAAHSLEAFASAVRRAGDELKEQDQGSAARFVNEAAESIHQVAGSIETTSVDDMMDQVNRFARRNPGAFVLGAVVAGVALGRFARASSERVHGDPYGRSVRGHATPSSRPAVGPSNSDRM